MLKTALSEQEETMEHQDMLIQQHEKNIEKIQKGTEHVILYHTLFGLYLHHQGYVFGSSLCVSLCVNRTTMKADAWV